MDGIRTAQHSTRPPYASTRPVRPSIFGTLIAFQDLRVCLSPNGSYVTHKILFLHCLQVIFFIISS